MAIGVYPGLFPQISFEEANPWLSGAKGMQGLLKGGQEFYQSNKMFPEQLKKAQLENIIEAVNAKYAEPKTQAELKGKQLENEWYAPKAKSQIALQGAQTNRMNTMTPLEAMELKLKNQLYPETTKTENAYRTAMTNKLNTMTPLEKQEAEINLKTLEQKNLADIEEKKSLAGYRQLGGGSRGAGVAAKDDAIFQQSIARDNPQFSPDDAYQASNIISQGGNQMPDGRPINASAATMRAFDRAVKGTTTSAIINRSVRSSQAEAEIGVLSRYAQKGLEPFGTSYFNMSPEQITSSFKDDEKSQKKLGKLIAAQQLQYEIAQNEIALAMGQPGVTSTEHLMQLGQQSLNLKFPRLSYTARQEANSYFLEALKEGVKARNKVGFGAGSLAINQNESRSERGEGKNEGEKVIPWKRDKNGKLVIAN